MNAEEFLQHVERAMPSRSVLQQYDLDDDEIAEVQATFTAPRRRPFAEGKLSEIERMVLEFDCSKLELGLVRFNEQLMSLPEGSCFGTCEADPLVVAADGTIALLDHAQPGSASQLCAGNAEKFLDGMATFVTLRSDKAAWIGKVEEAASLCARASGGLQYAEFFRLVCAFLHDPGS